jgi:uncharacterized protein
MSVLTDRLRGIVHAGHVPLPAGPASADAVRVHNLEEALGGTWASDRRSFVVERRFEPGARHGRVRVGDIAADVERAAADAALLPILTGHPFSPAPFVFFDLETTGLSGGAGTYAFLVGAGWFENKTFVVRQHLLVEYAAERAMLLQVNADFERAGSLVSFNGKSFDAPVLDTRYLFHRLEWPGAELPHVDALHVSRRFWRQAAGDGRRESCSLIALEEEILGARRKDDVPGFEIPARYFQFIRSGDARPLAAVFEHNRLDLLALAGITARLVRLACDGHSSARSPWEGIALGRAFARAGLSSRARAALEWAAESETNGAAGTAARLAALRSLALLLRRARLYDDAAQCWRLVLDVPSCPPLLAREANEALAIHHEHRVRDLDAAWSFALQSLGDGSGVGNESGWNDAVRHRLQRIERKRAPISGRPLFLSSSPEQPSSGSPTSAHRTSS